MLVKPILIVGTLIATFALIFYSIAVIAEQRSHKVKTGVLIFITFGILCDILGTFFMAMGSSNGLFTIHGILGFGALLGMLISVIFIWRLNMINGLNTEVPRAQHLHIRFSYLVWIALYFGSAVGRIVK